MQVQSSIQRTMGAADWSLLFLLSLFWGGAFFFTGVAVKEVPTFTIVVMRVGLGALFLWLFILAMRVRVPRDLASWRAFAVMGFLGCALPFCLLVWAQGHIASGLASILNATTPLFTVMVAHALTADEKLSGGRTVGVLFGLGGVVAMIGPDALRHMGDDVVAQIVALGAPVSYGFAAVYSRRMKGLGIPPLAAATGQVTTAVLMLLPLALVFDAPWTLPLPSTEAMGALLGLGLISTAFSYIIFFRIVSRAGATNISLVTFLIPISAILLGTLFLDEVLDPAHFLGFGMIGLGLAAIDGRPYALVRRLWAPRVPT